VTVTGLRLHLLGERLDQQRGFRLAADDPRFANIQADQPFVTGISILSP
jgi:hypothetical protein